MAWIKSAQPSANTIALNNQQLKVCLHRKDRILHLGLLTCILRVRKANIFSAQGYDMCLGIPMQVTEISGFTARCSAKGVERDVSLFLLQETLPSPGDYVMVHVGYAIQIITEQYAHSAWELYDEMLSAATELPDA
jgi:hydrogenase expression/formation protein HypC